MMTRALSMTCLLALSALSACGGSEPSQALPGPTSATRIGLDGEVIETIHYRYLDRGLLAERTSTSERLRFFYDTEERLALVEEEDEQRVYHYDALDRVERIERLMPSTREVLAVTRFQYDSEVRDRIVLRVEETPRAVVQPTRAFAYRYDIAGRLIEERPMNKGADVQYVYVDNGVLRHRDTGSLRRIFEVDQHGNVLVESVVSVEDETRVHERWEYGFEGWADASDEAKNAPRVDAEYLSATIR